MQQHIYETHRLPHSLLPFIFHKNFVIARRHSLPNWHENIELLYCTAGRGTISCGKKQYDFSPGNIFVVNANMPHCICSESSVMYCCLIIDNSFFESNGLAIGDLYFKGQIKSQEMCSLFEQVKAAFAAVDQGGRTAIADVRHAVLGMCRALCAHYVTDKPKDTLSSSNEYIKKALQYIRQNIDRPLTLEEIGSHVGLSKYHLAREFKTFTGKTIIETVNLIRCTEAKTLIEGGMGVSAAARNCGFQNLSYFTRTFKKYFHILPSALTNNSTDYIEPSEMMGC